MKPVKDKKIKQLSKFEILGFINLILGIIFLFFIKNIFLYPSAVNLNGFIHNNLPNGVIFTASILNFYLGYKLFWKQGSNRHQFSVYLILTLQTIFWFLWLFIGYFFVSELIYPVISLGLIAAVFIFVRKLSASLALLTSLVTLLVVILTLTFSFEEDYCWKKGDEMAAGKPSVTTIPAHEEREVFGDALGTIASDSAQVGTAAYYHFKCHQNFDFNPALKEKFNLQKFL